MSATGGAADLRVEGGDRIGMGRTMENTLLELIILNHARFTDEAAQAQVVSVSLNGWQDSLEGTPGV